MNQDFIENPILKGFNPDPSICRVGDDYYLATSTFEWFPGIQIHHSRDLKHWELIARPLDKVSFLDMKGVPDSCGCWAPCLSYSNGKFYLVYTNVRSFDGPWKDTPNYLITATNIHGPWSKPVYLNSSGFDGSLFHDKDKKWFLNMRVDHRNNRFFGGIEMQEYDEELKELVGEVFYLTSGTELGRTEGPHLYKKNGYYYLMLAEGGTEYGHAESMLRSRNISGPYENHPQNPIITCKNHSNHPIQKSGHASLVETQHGDWYIVFLLGRPLSPLGRCILGRETGIEEIIWQDDWPYIKAENSLPRVKIPIPNLTPYPVVNGIEKDDFDKQELDINFQALRIPISDDWLSIK